MRFEVVECASGDVDVVRIPIFVIGDVGVVSGAGLIGGFVPLATRVGLKYLYRVSVPPELNFRVYG